MSDRSDYLCLLFDKKTNLHEAFPNVKVVIPSQC